jgi:hypothetical protein
MAKKNKCQICSSDDVSLFFEIVNVPVHIGILWPSRDAAKNCPRGDIKLIFCRSCGFILNIAFDPTRLEYTQAYDNSLHFSPFFQAHAHSLAKRLIERYNLYNKNIIEIGSGKGDFLMLLCVFGNNRGIGFDPSYEGKFYKNEKAKHITFIKDFYSERYANYHADFICCRYVLEHIHNPTDFLSMLRHIIDNHLDTVLYFEVPNVLFILRDLSVWDIIYEHCSYFSLGSLAHIFTSCGFDIRDLNENYNGQYLSIEALPNKASVDLRHDYSDELKKLAYYMNTFPDNYRSKIKAWENNLERIKHKGQRAVAWGAGAKAVSFFNMLKIRDQIGYVVDINPHKHGKYISGTGQQIVPPEFLRDYKPDVVIIMNQIYKNEIQHTIKELNLTMEFLYA